MEWWKRTTRKVAEAAKTAVSESVKTEAKNLAATLVPTAIGIGVVLAGLAVFKSSMVKPTSTFRMPIPSYSKTVVNNWFLDETTKIEVLTRLINQ